MSGQFYDPAALLFGEKLRYSMHTSGGGGVQRRFLCVNKMKESVLNIGRLAPKQTELVSCFISFSRRSEIVITCTFCVQYPENRSGLDHTLIYFLGGAVFK
jgi:hypothetical protein